MTEDRAKCIAAGCSDYMSKPVSKELLLRTIASVLKSEIVAAPAAEQLRTAASAEKIRSTFASDPEMQELINTFVSRLPKRIERMMELMRSMIWSSCARWCISSRVPAGDMDSQRSPDTPPMSSG